MGLLDEVKTEEVVTEDNGTESIIHGIISALHVVRKQIEDMGTAVAADMKALDEKVMMIDARERQLAAIVDFLLAKDPEIIAHTQEAMSQATKTE